MTTNTLYNGDCLEMMKNIPDGSVDLILCDLPYGTTACKWDKSIPLDILWEHYRRVLKPYGTVLLFGSEPFASSLRLSNPSMYKYDWVWEKNNCGNFQLVNKQPMKVHETVSVFYSIPPFMGFSKIITDNMERLGLSFTSVSMLVKSKNGNPTGWLSNKISGKQLPTREQWKLLCGTFGIEDRYDEILAEKNGSVTYNMELSETDVTLSNKRKGGRLKHIGSEKMRDEYRQTKTGYPRSVLRFKREVGYHPTQKPVPLLEYLIKTHSNEGDVVLDNCMGSGSTGVACVNTGRNFIGIELDRKYYMVANDRIDEAGKRLF